MRKVLVLLEHPTATTVVFPEVMPKEELVKSMKMMLFPRIFHIVTPLNITLKEIQYFDYNTKCQNIYGCMKELQSILLTYFKLTKD
jgi:hypothetical protein